MKNEELPTQQLKEQGYPSIGGIRRAGGASQRISTVDNWIHGKARIEGDSVYLDANSREEYCPEKEDRLVLLDFLNLDVQDRGNVIKFVEQYGLLSDVGLENGYEDLDSWDETHSNISKLIRLHLVIQRANRDEVGAFNNLATITDGRYAQSLKALQERINLSLDEVKFHKDIVERHEKGTFGDKNTLYFSNKQKEELLNASNIILSSQLSVLMDKIAVGVCYRPLSLPQKSKKSPKSSLVLDYRSPDLYGYLWIQVAFLAIDGKNIGLCKCGIYYPMTRAGRQTCKEGCGSNMRSRKKRAQDKEISI